MSGVDPNNFGNDQYQTQGGAGNNRSGFNDQTGRSDWQSQQQGYGGQQDFGGQGQQNFGQSGQTGQTGQGWQAGQDQTDQSWQSGQNQGRQGAGTQGFQGAGQNPSQYDPGFQSSTGGAGGIGGASDNSDWQGSGVGQSGYDDQTQGDNYDQGAGGNAGGKPGLGSRLKGGMEKVAGKVSGDSNLQQRGQARKEGDF